MDITSINDEYVRLAQEAVLGVSISVLPGTFWAEYFPLLRYLPAWFPGSSFKRIMDHYRPITQEMRSKPFDKIREDMVSLPGLFLASAMMPWVRCLGEGGSRSIVDHCVDRTAAAQIRVQHA